MAAPRQILIFRYRVLERLGENEDEIEPWHVIKELTLGSTLERFRKFPTNEQLVREMRIRFERSQKLLDGIATHFETVQKIIRFLIFDQISKNKKN